MTPSDAAPCGPELPYAPSGPPAPSHDDSATKKAVTDDRQHTFGPECLSMQHSMADKALAEWLLTVVLLRLLTHGGTAHRSSGCVALSVLQPVLASGMPYAL